jgi:signal recognition particle subunit SRP19
MRFRIQGMPMPKDGKILPPAIPRGSKIGQILPLHSPALSGGGVSDNFLQDVMNEMGGQLPPGINPDMLSALGGGMGGMGGMGGGGAGGSVKKVKEKKKK